MNFALMMDNGLSVLVDSDERRAKNMVKKDVRVILAS
jgi:hypothetical protein